MIFGVKYNKKTKITNVKNNKLKFFFIIILPVIALLFISLHNIISSCEDPIIKKHVQLLINNNEQFIQIEKSKSYYTNEMTENYQELNDNDIDQINKKLKKLNKTGAIIYKVGKKHIESGDIMAFDGIFNIMNIKNAFNDSKPYTYQEEQFQIVEWKNFEDFFSTKIIGRIPINNDEIMISNHFADVLITAGIKPYKEDIYYKPPNYKELVTSNKYFHFGITDKVKIVGIINYNLAEFESLKNISWDEFNSNLKEYSGPLNKLYYKNKNIYNKIFVTTEFINQLTLNNENAPDAIWQNKIIKTGVLITENTKKGFKKLLQEFKYDKPIIAKSSYNELIDDIIQIHR